MKSKLQTLNNLKDLSYELSLKAAADLPGEPFEEGYKKNKDAFRVLMKADTHITKWFTNYFKELAVKVGNKLNPVEYNLRLQKMQKASILDDLIQIDWTKEGINIRVFMIEELIAVLQAGSLSLEDIPGFPKGLITTTAQAMKFLEGYSAELVKGLNNTTRDNISTSLKTSISLGENQELATTRLRTVIDDPVRASVIAHTETVRAFNEGRIQTGLQLGATQKEWKTTIIPCDICGGIKPKIVGIDEQFVNPDSGDKFDNSPAHPRCRCLVYPILPQ